MEIIDFLLQWEEDDSQNKSRDTFEVLNALTQVDIELEGVDFWISEQIERLSQVCMLRYDYKYEFSYIYIYVYLHM